MNAPDHYYDDFREDLSNPQCVQEIYDFSLRQVRGLVDYNDEDDVIQEVFYRLTRWPISTNYNSKRHYFSLLRITIRQAIAAYWKRRHSQRNDVRKRRYISELISDSQKVEFSDAAKSPWYNAHLKEAVRRLLDRAETLEPNQREMFRLRFMEEKPHDEISELLGISLRSSYRLEKQVRDLLRNSLPNL